MADLEVAVRVRPYERLAGQPFVIDIALASDNGTDQGLPEDLSDVSAALVSAQQRVASGARPAATHWTIGGGQVAIDSAVIDAVTYPTLVVTEPEGLPAGTYDLLFSLTRSGIADWVLKATLELTAQP